MEWRRRRCKTRDKVEDQTWLLKAICDIWGHSFSASHWIFFCHNLRARVQTFDIIGHLWLNRTNEKRETDYLQTGQAQVTLQINTKLEGVAEQICQDFSAAWRNVSVIAEKVTRLFVGICLATVRCSYRKFVTDLKGLLTQTLSLRLACSLHYSWEYSSATDRLPLFLPICDILII